MTDRSADAFLATARRAGVAPAAAVRLLTELTDRLGEPHRRYHVVAHVDRVLHDLRATASGLPDTTAVELAAWYHDVVYDPRVPAGANEEASARLAIERLTGAGVGARLVDDVARLVRVTADHRPVAADEAALCDADLAILAADAPAYEAYVRAVRQEYGHVGEGAWRIGRGRVLEHLLALERLFHTQAAAGWEEPARRNLRAELAALRGG